MIVPRSIPPFFVTMVSLPDELVAVGEGAESWVCAKAIEGAAITVTCTAAASIKAFAGVRMSSPQHCTNRTTERRPRHGHGPLAFVSS